MDKEKVKNELKELIKEMFTNDELKELKEIEEEKLAKLLEDKVQKELKEYFEKLPADKKKIAVPGTDKDIDVIVHGYDVRKQARNVDFANDEDRIKFAKTTILLLKAAQGDPEAKAELKALGEGSGSGSYLVIPDYEDTVFAFARLQSVALRDATVMTVNTDKLYIPVESALGDLYWYSEGDTISGSEPTITQVEIDVKKAGGYAVVSNELLEDSAVDIVSYLVSGWSEKIALGIDTEVFVGTNGVFGNIIDNVPAANKATAASLTYPACSECVSKLPANKIAGAKFYMHRSFADALRTQSDGTNYIWNPAMPLPNTVAGYPVELVESMPSSATQAGDCMAIFANLKNYLILRRTGMRVDIDPYGNFLNDQTRVRYITRLGGHLRVASAYAGVFHS